MKVWLDDIRPKPSNFDISFTTAQEMISFLEQNAVTEISLDHDLGDDAAGTGYDVAQWIEEQAYYNLLPRLKWNIHSQNPVGIAKMKTALKNADRFWLIHELSE